VFILKTADNTRIDSTIVVGEDPLSMGQFMQPDNIFVGIFEPGPK